MAIFTKTTLLLIFGVFLISILEWRCLERAAKSEERGEEVEREGRGVVVPHLCSSPSPFHFLTLLLVHSRLPKTKR